MRRLRFVSILGLYGIFDHEFALKESEGVTIITAPNGYGKTVVLRIINLFYSGEYLEFLSIEFASILLVFSDGSEIRLSREAISNQQEEIGLEDSSNPDSRGTPALQLRLSVVDAEDQVWPITPGAPISEISIERFFPYIRRVSARIWVDTRNGTNLSATDVQRMVDRHGGRRPRQREPDWLRKFRTSMNCRFIETQRLLRVGTPRRVADEEEYIRPVVTELAVNLKGAIQQKLAEYALTAQSLESTYPRRLISKTLERLPEAELQRCLNELDAERSKLMEAGLLDREEALEISSQGISPDIIDALSIYVADTATKLKVFQELFEKIQVFRRILNNRLNYKSLSIDKENGLTVKRFDGVTLALTGLSSGEQHELVLMYELLFSVEPNSLILIDEPELSLHVSWQSDFLSDISDIISLRKFYVMIATHSPQIINDRWDLAIELQGPTLLRRPSP